MKTAGIAVMVIGLVAIALALGYLVTTALVAVALWCTDALGLWTFDGSVWVAGLLVYVVVLILGKVFNRGGNSD